MLERDGRDGFAAAPRESARSHQSSQKRMMARLSSARAALIAAFISDRDELPIRCGRKRRAKRPTPPRLRSRLLSAVNISDTKGDEPRLALAAGDRQQRGFHSTLLQLLYCFIDFGNAVHRLPSYLDDDVACKEPL